jgi:hypothetical protein
MHVAISPEGGVELLSQKTFVVIRHEWVQSSYVNLLSISGLFRLESFRG